MLNAVKQQLQRADAVRFELVQVTALSNKERIGLDEVSEEVV
jgi:hypothetical protein